MPPAKLTFVGIADDIESRIRSGEYAAGVKLPSISQLAYLYSVSVSTVVRSMALLRDRKLVDGVQGIGVFVRDVSPKGGS